MTTLVPNEVVALVFAGDLSPMRAWREHLGLTGWRVGRSSARGKQIRGQGPLLPTRTATAVGAGHARDSCAREGKRPIIFARQFA